MSVEVVEATFRDLSYIAANMRPEDREECDAQLGDIDSMELAAGHLRDFAFAVRVDGNPEAAFGACRILGFHLWTAWSFGTPRIGRAVPAIVRHVRRVMIPAIYDLGAQRVEARALGTNTGAHRWIRAMGGRQAATLECYGRDGQDFVLFDWTRKRFAPLQKPDGGDHLFLKSQAA